MKLKEITFIFENCEHITISGIFVGDFTVDNIHTSIKRIACNSIQQMNCCDDFAIEIRKEAYFLRFKGNDITSIKFTLYDDYGKMPDKNYDYYVKWTGDNEYVNAAQKTVVSDLGHMYIVISDKPFEDFFDLDEINDEYTNSKLNMYLY